MFLFCLLLMHSIEKKKKKWKQRRFFHTRHFSTREQFDEKETKKITAMRVLFFLASSLAFAAAGEKKMFDSIESRDFPLFRSKREQERALKKKQKKKKQWRRIDFFSLSRRPRKKTEKTKKNRHGRRVPASSSPGHHHLRVRPPLFVLWIRLSEKN